MNRGDFDRRDGGRRGGRQGGGGGGGNRGDYRGGPPDDMHMALPFGMPLPGVMAFPPHGAFPFPPPPFPPPPGFAFMGPGMSHGGPVMGEREGAGRGRDDRDRERDLPPMMRDRDRPIGGPGPMERERSGREDRGGGGGGPPSLQDRDRMLMDRGPDRDRGPPMASPRGPPAVVPRGALMDRDRGGDREVGGGGGRDRDRRGVEDDRDRMGPPLLGPPLGPPMHPRDVAPSGWISGPAPIDRLDRDRGGGVANNGDRELPPRGDRMDDGGMRDRPERMNMMSPMGPRTMSSDGPRGGRRGGFMGDRPGWRSERGGGGGGGGGPMPPPSIMGGLMPSPGFERERERAARFGTGMMPHERPSLLQQQQQQQQQGFPPRSRSRSPDRPGSRASSRDDSSRESSRPSSRTSSPVNHLNNSHAHTHHAAGHNPNLNLNSNPTGFNQAGKRVIQLSRTRPTVVHAQPPLPSPAAAAAAMAGDRSTSTSPSRRRPPPHMAGRSRSRSRSPPPMPPMPPVQPPPLPFQQAHSHAEAEHQREKDRIRAERAMEAQRNESAGGPGGFYPPPPSSSASASSRFSSAANLAPSPRSATGGNAPPSNMPPARGPPPQQGGGGRMYMMGSSKARGGVGVGNDDAMMNDSPIKRDGPMMMMRGGERDQRDQRDQRDRMDPRDRDRDSNPMAPPPPRFTSSTSGSSIHDSLQSPQMGPRVGASGRFAGPNGLPMPPPPIGFTPGGMPSPHANQPLPPPVSNRWFTGGPNPLPPPPPPHDDEREMMRDPRDMRERSHDGGRGPADMRDSRGNMMLPPSPMGPPIGLRERESSYGARPGRDAERGDGRGKWNMHPPPPSALYGNDGGPMMQRAKSEPNDGGEREMYGARRFGLSGPPPPSSSALERMKSGSADEENASTMGSTGGGSSSARFEQFKEEPASSAAAAAAATPAVVDAKHASPKGASRFFDSDILPTRSTTITTATSVNVSTTAQSSSLQGASRFFDSLSVRIPSKTALPTSSPSLGGTGASATRVHSMTTSITTTMTSSASLVHASPAHDPTKKLLFHPSPASSPLASPPLERGESDQLLMEGAGGRRLQYDGYPAASPEHGTPAGPIAFPPFVATEKSTSGAAAASGVGVGKDSEDKDSKSDGDDGDEDGDGGGSSSSSDEDVPDIPRHMLTMSKSAILRAIKQIDESVSTNEEKKERLKGDIEEAARLAAKHAKLAADQIEREAKAKEARDKAAAAAVLKAQAAALAKAAAGELNEKQQLVAGDVDMKDAALIALEESIAKLNAEAAASAVDPMLLSPSPPLEREISSLAGPSPLQQHAEHRLATWFKSHDLSRQLEAVDTFRVLAENSQRARQAHEYVAKPYDAKLHRALQVQIRAQKLAMAAHHHPERAPMEQAKQAIHALAQVPWGMADRMPLVTVHLVMAPASDPSSDRSVAVQIEPVMAKRDRVMELADMAEESAKHYPRWLQAPPSSSSAKPQRQYLTQFRSRANAVEPSRASILTALQQKLRALQSGRVSLDPESQLLADELMKLTQVRQTSTNGGEEEKSNEDPAAGASLDLFALPLELRSDPYDSEGDDLGVAGPLYSEPTESALYQANLHSFAAKRNRVVAVVRAHRRAQHQYLLQLTAQYREIERQWLQRHHAMLQAQHAQINGMKPNAGAAGKETEDGRRSSLRSRQASDGLQASPTSSSTSASATTWQVTTESFQASLSYYTSLTQSQPAPSLPAHFASLMPTPASTLPPDEDQKRLRYMRCTATLPDLIVDERERRARAFDSRNGLVLDAAAEERAYKSRNPWTEAEKRIFERRFLKHPKQFRKIASFLPGKNVNECVAYYYYSKLSVNYRKMLRAQNRKNKKTQPTTGSAAANNILQAGGSGYDSPNESGQPFSPNHDQEELAHARNPYAAHLATKQTARGGLALMAPPLTGEEILAAYQRQQAAAADSTAASGPAGGDSADPTQTFVRAPAPKGKEAKKSRGLRELVGLAVDIPVGEAKAAAAAAASAALGAPATMTGRRPPAQLPPQSPLVTVRTPAAGATPAPLATGSTVWEKEKEAAAAATTTTTVPSATTTTTTASKKKEKEPLASPVKAPKPTAAPAATTPTVPATPTEKAEKMKESTTSSAPPAAAAVASKEEPSSTPSKQPPKRDRTTLKKKQAAASDAAAAASATTSSDEESSMASSDSESVGPRRKKAKREDSATKKSDATATPATSSKGSKKRERSLSDVDEEDSSEPPPAAKSPAPAAAATKKAVRPASKAKEDQTKKEQQPPTKKQKVSATAAATPSKDKKEKAPEPKKKVTKKVQATKKAAAAAAASSSSSSSSSSSESESASASESDSDADASDSDEPMGDAATASSNKSIASAAASGDDGDASMAPAEESDEENAEQSSTSSSSGSEEDEAASGSSSGSESEDAEGEEGEGDESDESTSSSSGGSASDEEGEASGKKKAGAKKPTTPKKVSKDKSSAKSSSKSDKKSPGSGSASGAAAAASLRKDDREPGLPWTSVEREAFLVALESCGKSWPDLSKAVGTKGVDKCKNFFNNNKTKLKLQEKVDRYEEKAKKATPAPAATSTASNASTSAAAAATPAPKTPSFGATPTSAHKSAVKHTSAGDAPPAKEKSSASSTKAASARPSKEKDAHSGSSKGEKSKSSSDTAKARPTATPASAKDKEKEKAKSSSDKKDSKASTPSSGAAGGDLSRDDPMSWTNTERQSLFRAIQIFGRQWDRIASMVGSRSQAQVEGFYKKFKTKLNLQELMNQAEELRRGAMKGSPHKKR